MFYSGLICRAVSILEDFFTALFRINRGLEINAAMLLLERSLVPHELVAEDSRNTIDQSTTVWLT